MARGSANSRGRPTREATRQRHDDAAPAPGLRDDLRGACELALEEADSLQRSRFEQALEWTGVDAPADAIGKLRSARRLVLMTLAFESWFTLGYVPYSSHPLAYGCVALCLLGCAIAGWRDRFERFATPVAFVLLLGVVVSVFPENANHQYLMLCLLLLIGLAKTSGSDAARDARAAVGSIRWVALLGVVWAGVMKLHYGYWFGGEFLSFRVATDPGFTQTLGLLVPDAELSRLLTLGVDVGAGPFRADAPLLVVVSNLTWFLEILLPLGLLWARTRMLSLIATMALFVAIQLSAREVFFGGLMVGLLLLFARRDRLAQALPLLACIYAGWLLRADILRLISGGHGG